MRIKALIIIVFVFQSVLHAENIEGSPAKPKISPEINISFQSGQYVKSRYSPFNGQNQTLGHLWLGDMVGHIGLIATPEDWLKLKVSIDARIWLNKWPTSLKQDFNGTISYNKDVSLGEAYGLFSLLRDWPYGGLEVALGQFSYKYNPDVRDLGEYLFRTGTYPIYISNQFDFPMARLTGLRIGFNSSTRAQFAGGSLLGFNLDGLLLTEREMAPFNDFTLAFIGGVHAFKALDIGAGVSFAHLWSVNDSLTTPKNVNNFFVENESDTGYYTFKGTKLMFRASIDPVFFLRGKEGFLGELFGKQGLKLYSEMAFIGLKSYPSHEINNPFGYDDIKRKRPIVLGFTIPMWKILDVLSVELEHFDCPYPNSTQKIMANNLPLPLNINPNDLVYDSTAYSKDSWKFCVYAKKNVGEHVGFIFQASRDHQGWETDPLNWKNRDYEDAFVKWNEWSWHFKTEYRL